MSASSAPSPLCSITDLHVAPLHVPGMALQAETMQWLALHLLLSSWCFSARVGGQMTGGRKEGRREGEKEERKERWKERKEGGRLNTLRPCCHGTSPGKFH